MQAVPDRLRLLLSIFAAAGRSQDGRPTTEQLALLSGISGNTLRPGYRSDLRPETLDRVADAVAQLLVGSDLLTGEQAARLAPWLQGEEHPDLQQRLDLESQVVKCTGEGDIPCAESRVMGVRARFFHPEKDAVAHGGAWEPRLRMCLRHVRAKQTPAAAAWEEQFARDLPRAPLVPVIEAHLREQSPEEPAPKLAAEARKRRDKIVEAFDRARAAFQSVKYRPWAEDAGFEEKEMRRLLSRAGLPEKPRAGKKHFNRYVIAPILAYLLSGIQAEAAVAETPRSPDPQVYLIGGLRAWLLEQFRRWAQADRLRQWLAGLAGTGCSGAPVLSLGCAS